MALGHMVMPAERRLLRDLGRYLHIPLLSGNGSSMDISWSLLWHTLSTPRDAAAAALYDETIYTFGGSTVTPVGGPVGGTVNYMDTVEAFDIQSGQSVPLPDVHLPQGVTDHLAAV